MDFTVEPFRKRDEELWDSFVGESANGTIFHTRRFLNYHPPDRFKDYSHIIRKRGRLAGLFPAALTMRDGKSWVVSHAGTSYGGIVYDRTMSVRDAYDMVQCLVTRFREDGYHRIRLTLPPLWYDIQPNHYIEFALLKSGFRYDIQELTSVVSLQALPESVQSAFGESTRRAIRKAQKSGIIIEFSDDISGYYPILERNLSMRHNVTPTHTLAELTKLKSLYPDKILLLAAFYRKKMIGGIMPFICNRRTALAFYISNDMDFQHLRPVDCLMESLLQWAKDTGFLYVDFGTFTLKMEPNWGLGKFKEKFGAKGAFRSTLILPE